MLNRIKEHLANQNWTAVVLEFLIVVCGVAIGFQITEWNRGRVADEVYQTARAGLIDETRENITRFENYAEAFAVKDQAMSEAIKVLKSCETDQDARDKVTTGLEVLRLTNSPFSRTAAAKRITDDPLLISRQSETERLRLERFYETLASANEIVRSISEFNQVIDVDTHPAVGFGEFYTSEFSTGFQQRRPVLAVPLAQACRDESFIRLFYLAERRVNYLIPFVANRIANFEDNLDAMGASELVVSE